MRAKALRRAVRTGRPPKEFAAEVDERIFNAARELVLAHGLAGASVAEIASFAHASKGTIYARFPTKEALFAAIAIRNSEKVRLGYENAPSLGATIEERLTAPAMRSSSTCWLRTASISCVGSCRSAISLASPRSDA
ncbi:TetR/AcrR family transcriptional regulator [Bradyrhizobium sp. DOA9]|uniref:TetR/AcrR family transcriptional regulator n=1 Tax=Bradyrhizobium sp. DOA9 TaxID=1126627 RepID=UPI00049993CA|nr:TetR/AcrR family transcriptional regulator [Bradyrhizobium sp. DOA9]GAJ37974.1 hypothetical protein BDOA9_0205920 [Bradyrhizobium sp. DOA9]